MSSWQAFIDESGDFSRPEPVVVAAVLCRGAPPQPPLRAALERALPGMPYPLHAAHLNVRLFPAAALLMDPSLGGRADAAARAAAELLASSENPVASSLAADCDRVRKERLPSHKVDLGLLKRADAWLAGADERVYGRLNDLSTRHQRALLDLLGSSAAELRVAAAWQAGGDTGGDPNARYSLLVGCLAERLEQLLGGPRAVALVLRPSARKDAPAPRLGPLPGHPGRVSVLVGRGEPYNRDVHPAFVFADVAANRLRTLLGRVPWSQVRSTWGCTADLEQAPSFSQRLLPVVAADGPTRLAIRGAFAGTRKAECLAGLNRVGSWWVHDEAAAWIGATP